MAWETTTTFSDAPSEPDNDDAEAQTYIESLAEPSYPTTGGHTDWEPYASGFIHESMHNAVRWIGWRRGP